MARWKFVLLPALIKWGLGGVFAVALLDSSSIPVPVDAILAVYIWNDRPHFWLYCLLAAVGSAIGGLVPYGLGRAGGELFLLKRVNRQRFEKLRDRFESQEFLAMLIPSMMPPPTPWKAFVFAAGVFEMNVVPFMLAVALGRMIRWMALSLLVLKFGPDVVSLVAHHAAKATLIVIALAALGFALWWIKKKRSGQLDVE
ncbi:MAG: VTT domain-containing protein [Terracidiphilus sp.]|nr:VTT domain-containing protein [Terracidiphilus sp.]